MSLFAELKRRNVIRVAVAYIVFAWLVLQVADIVFPAVGLPEWTITLVVVLLAIGLVPTLIFSWVFELTPEGVKKESEVDRSRSITHQTARKLDIAVILLLVVGIGLVVAGQFGWLPSASAPAEPAMVQQASPEAPADSAGESLPRENAPDERSIAVLPFLNLSSDPEQEYFSDGLAESLLHMLAQIHELQVAARTSSFRFKNHSGDVSEIGQQLKVAHVLEGSVRRAGNTVRVTAQLIKVDDGFHLWSGTYDRPLDDIFGIQDEIATHVVDALKVALLGEVEATLSSRDTDNLEAYEAFLKGRQDLAVASHSTLPEAERHMQRAVELDPGYVLAWESLGLIYARMANTGFLPFAEAARKIAPIADHLAALEPDSGVVWAMRAYALRYGQRGDFDQVDQLFQRAYEKDPDNEFLVFEYATFLDWTGFPERAVVIAGKALERDPMSTDLHMRLGYAYRRMDEFDKALFHGRRLEALEPDGPTAQGLIASIQNSRGQYVEAIKAFRRARELDPEDYELPAEEAMLLMAMGELEQARRLIDLGQSIQPDGVLPQAAEVALLYRKGDLEAAADLALSIVRSGVEARHWSGFVLSNVLRDRALAAGHHDLILEDWAEWVGSVDLINSEIAGQREVFPKLFAVPVLRAAGQHDLADAIVDNARSYLQGDQSGNIPLAIASGEIDAIIQALEANFLTDRRADRWLAMASRSLDGARQDPRFQKLDTGLKELAEEQHELFLRLEGETAE